MAKKPKSKNRTKKILLGLLVVFSFMVYSYNSALQPIGVDTAIVFDVSDGDTMNSVLDTLEEEGLIKNSFAAKVYVKLNAKNALKTGSYELKGTMSIPEIIDTLIKPSSYSLVVRLPEGSWAKDVALLLEENLGFESGTFLALWNNEEYVASLIDTYEVLTSDILKNKKQVRVLLEGYLYPDTYNFTKTMSAKQVTEFILNNTERKYLSLKDDFAKTKLSVHDVFNLASIVMYEAGDSSNQLMVAGVFMNRLEMGMNLQSSVTVCYTLYEFSGWEECELFKNQKIESPYNTYLNPGLPAGPILNPTVEAIKSTLNYTDHDYLFFVADVYDGGDGTVYYSKTFEQHSKKVKELRGR